jgi:hypothetical protein
MLQTLLSHPLSHLPEAVQFHAKTISINTLLSQIYYTEMTCSNHRVVRNSLFMHVVFTDRLLNMTPLTFWTSDVHTNSIFQAMWIQCSAWEETMQKKTGKSATEYCISNDLQAYNWVQTSGQMTCCTWVQTGSCSMEWRWMSQGKKMAQSL